ncbi:D-glycero-alpha-D-manno-heptose-1,7-bisphosphate 7-phosphatase [Cupriavidus taiwanensis]|uniref:D-glycero-alpha-D-manno-heptose-1,7-bisphosphate 7-phosphatase n=1 Tax=Cupriavidus taiwanensis TaxID=164546 RepID=UPI000E1022DF|nr:HAD-IIIA family hydrolase [Cupriavidus taiwanensis]SPA48220.1 D,D-heptose 1,7-bisphosphate phosphatase (D-glycero-D- manno-heptose 1,7-bisphosphate phosphatase) [Cupriavidus taiwanensis]
MSLAAPLRAAVLLDKDGTVLDDVPYNVDPARMRFAPGAAAALRLLGGLGLPLVVVTNQPGVAHGLHTEAELVPVRERLAAMFAEHGAALSGFLYCPHHPEGQVAPYARACLCRKPMPGLLLQAAAAWRLDLARSWMIGDILNDVEAGNRAGCATVLVDCGNETEWQLSPARQADYVVPTLDAAARLVVARTRAADSAGAAASRAASPCRAEAP